MLYRSNQPIKCRCCPHIETSQLIYTANQLTGFYMKATLTFNGLNDKFLGSHITIKILERQFEHFEQIQEVTTNKDADTLKSLINFNFN